MEVSFSDKFDTVYEDIKRILDGEGINDTIEAKSAEFHRLQLELEDMTRTASALEMFSKNEVYSEIDPKSLKFLLLPYFLGVIWQHKVSIDRKDVWDITIVYFQDFLERLLETEVLLCKPKVLGIIQRNQESSNEETESMVKSIPTGDENRRLKIARFKQNKELDEKIKILSRREKNSMDTSTTRELYLNLLRKSAVEAEAELESILTEKELVSLAQSVKDGVEKRLPQPSISTLPFKTFILTKTDIQKKTFGRGYPSIPIMTVEELYRDRVEKGIWSKPTSTTDVPPEALIKEDEELAQQEVLEETENEAYRATQQATDEYKDTHRRGWGNRMNRS